MIQKQELFSLWIKQVLLNYYAISCVNIAASRSLGRKYVVMETAQF